MSGANHRENSRHRYPQRPSPYHQSSSRNSSRGWRDDHSSNRNTESRSNPLQDTRPPMFRHHNRIKLILLRKSRDYIRSRSESSVSATVAPSSAECALDLRVKKESKEEDKKEKPREDKNHTIEENKAVSTAPVYSQDIEYLFDCCVGKLADLLKWKELPRLQSVTGVDISVSHLKTAAFRLDQQPREWRKRVHLIQLDMSTAEGVDSASKLMRHNSQDVVNIHFAIHYFFKSSDILLRLLQLMYDKLQHGGLVVGTCLDGDAVWRAVLSYHTKHKPSSTKPEKSTISPWTLHMSNNGYVTVHASQLMFATSCQEDARYEREQSTISMTEGTRTGADSKNPAAILASAAHLPSCTTTELSTLLPEYGVEVDMYLQDSIISEVSHEYLVTRRMMDQAFRKVGFRRICVYNFGRDQMFSTSRKSMSAEEANVSDLNMYFMYVKD